LLGTAWAAALASPVAPPARFSDTVPFRRLGGAELSYHGVSEDFTNLAALTIGWFGPTNLADPLHGDLWFAANLAVREANTPPVRFERPTTDDQRSTFNVQRSTFRDQGPKPKDQRPTSDPELPTSNFGSGPSPFALRPSNFDFRPSDFDFRPSNFPLPLQLVPRWAADPWGTGVSQLTRMVYEEQPLALLGSVDSASTHLAEQVVAKANLPLLSPVATDRTATLAGVPWIFACAPSDDAIADALVEAVQTELRDSPARFVLLNTTDHASRMTAGAARRAFSRSGRLPDYQFQVPPGVVDLTRTLAALVEARPAVVIMIAGAEDAARWLAAVRAALPEASLYGGPEAGRHRFRELAGAAGETVRFPELVQPDPHDPEWVRFRDEFVAARGHPPDHAAVLTYDGARLLIEAIRRAGPNRARIRECLIRLSPWPGLGGEIRFDNTGQNTRAGLRWITAAEQRRATAPRRRRKAALKRSHSKRFAIVWRCGGRGTFGVRRLPAALFVAPVSRNFPEPLRP
jgi:branched-chain amino acid transport system substrate-binding protein